MERLKQNPETRHIPVHFISVYDQPLDAMKMGAIGYLTKPVSPENLNEAFETIEAAISRDIKKLLVVEDDEITRISICELLNSDDVEIMTVSTGEEAFGLLRAEMFDCMVVDLGLGDMSGFQLLEKIEDDETIVPLPIIVYTGKELTKEEERQLKKHTESVIIKGVRSPERLLDEVTLFLHQVTARLPEKQQQKLRMLHDKDHMLSEKIILMVDDDMRNLFALSSLLEERGVTVELAENAKDALSRLDREPTIDLVLMDIMMPEMDGYEAIAHIRKNPQSKQLPIIALTAKAMKGDRQKCIEAGANDYLSKPIDIDKLISLLRVWLY
jgi:tubulin-specific chaperone A